MPAIANYLNNDRRIRTDRRSSDIIVQFPIITTQGVCVRRDRRYTPERRVSGIEVKEWNVKDAIFDLLFEDMPTEKQSSNK